MKYEELAIKKVLRVKIRESSKTLQLLNPIFRVRTARKYGCHCVSCQHLA